MPVTYEDDPEDEPNGGPNGGTMGPRQQSRGAPFFSRRLRKLCPGTSIIPCLR